MNRLVDYHLTDDEKKNRFGSIEGYEDVLRFRPKDSICDSERIDIAYILFWRGKKNDAKKMIESIKNTDTLRWGRQQYAQWNAPPLTMVTSLGLDPLI